MQLNEIVDARVATGDRAILKTVRRWKTADGDFSAFYFRGEVCRGKDVSVYAVMGAPRDGGPFPGVLHYHGGGQTANPELVDQLVRRGYAAISFDWTGPCPPRRHVTRWNGCTPRYGGMAPDESLLIRALAAGCQTLSILSEDPRVDPERLGMFGVSWGGFQTWLLNAIDDRLRAAVAIYGCGITRSQALAYLRFRDGLKIDRRFNPEAWMERFNPSQYAGDQQGAVLFLNGTNDFFGWMDTFRRLCPLLDERHRAAFAPHFNHSIGTLDSTFLTWLDFHLRGGAFPERPATDGKWNRGGLELRSPVLPGAKGACFWVASENGVGPDLFWMPVHATRRGRFFEARFHLSLLHARRVMFFVQQRFDGGVESASFPVRISGVPSRAQTGQDGTLPLSPEVWHGPAPVDPLQPFMPLRGGTHRGRRCLEWNAGADRNFSFNTRIMAMPRYRMPAGAKFFCRLRGPIDGEVTVALLQYAGSPREQHFEGRFRCADLEKGVPPGVFRDSRGKPLRAGVVLSHLYIGGKTSSRGTVRLLEAGLRR